MKKIILLSILSIICLQSCKNEALEELRRHEMEMENRQRLIDTQNHIDSTNAVIEYHKR